LRFILSSGGYIDEVLHLRADNVSIVVMRVGLIGRMARRGTFERLTQRY
jgi:hypothetical protein